MPCKNDGMGSYVGYTVTQDGQCSTTNVAAAQALIQGDGTAITGGLLLKQKGAPEWRAFIDRTPSPRTQDGVGTFENMRFGNVWHHDEIPIDFEWPWENDFDMTLLLGSEGTLRVTGSDGSYWSGTAKVTSVPVQPNRNPGEDSVGQIVFSWKGGDSQPSYTAP